MWVAPYSLLAAAITPGAAATGDLTNYILGYGPLGIAVVVGAILLYKGWQLISPARLAAAIAAAREDGRADLLREIERLAAEKTHGEEQRDEAVSFIRERLVPLVSEFTSSTGALIPILQGLVAHLELTGRGDDRGREPRRERR